MQTGFDSAFPGFGAAFIAITLIFFCLTTVIAYYYMAETNLRFLVGGHSKKLIPGLKVSVGRSTTMTLQILILIAVAYGSVNTAADAWLMGDIGVGMMAWLNIIGILILQKPALAALKDFEAQQKMGIDPVFNPRPLGITGPPSGRPTRPPTARRNPRGSSTACTVRRAEHAAHGHLPRRGVTITRQFRNPPKL
ncbi:sodium/proton-dependent alanine carrier protein [Arthrobacter sp. Hiyo4]|nr:sodium/proton-dependent alanine carrier protein [Arthrobacter sp. Hiyo4]